MSHGRSSTDIIKRRCTQLKISCDHFRKVGTATKALYSLEEILVENSTYTNTTRLKNRLLTANLLENKCAICGNTGIWLDKPLSL